MAGSRVFAKTTRPATAPARDFTDLGNSESMNRSAISSCASAREQVLVAAVNHPVILTGRA